jgi:hypothetical protein
MYISIAVARSDAVVLLALALAGVSLLINIAAAVFIIRLAATLYNVPIAVLCGIFALLPCFNILMLVFINSQATYWLKKEGIRVGLLGANLSKI